MKIAINVSPLKSAHQYRGIGFYTKNLIWALQKYQPENEYTFFTRIANLPKNADLVHYPFFDLFHWTLPLFKKFPTVVTIHDLTPLVFADKFPRGIEGEIKWQVQKFSLKNVSAIITDSDNSKTDIVELTSFPKGKIYVVPLAAGKEFEPLTTGNKLLTETRRKYFLPERFILYVGDVNWNKNIGGMLRAFHKIKNEKLCRRKSRAPKSLDDSSLSRIRRTCSIETSAKIKNTNQKLKIEELKLVLVGKAFENESLKETREIDQLIKKLNIEDSVLKLGFVPTQDLVAIYNLASVYCQLSFYEGFGLPCLEAMVCGTPVVAANIPVLREVCGELAIYVDPYDVSRMASGMLEVFKLNGSNHLTLVKRGLRRVETFSWKKVAEETVKVYEKIVA